MYSWIMFFYIIISIFKYKGYKLVFCAKLLMYLLIMYLFFAFLFLIISDVIINIDVIRSITTKVVK